MRTKKYLKNKSKTYKKELFQKFLLLGEGHPGSIFSMMDIVVSLYHNGSKVIAKNGDLEFNLGSILWNQTGDAYEDGIGWRPISAEIFNRPPALSVDFPDGNIVLLWESKGVWQALSFSSKDNNNFLLCEALIIFSESFSPETDSSLSVFRE